MSPALEELQDLIDMLQKNGVHTYEYQGLKLDLWKEESDDEETIYGHTEVKDKPSSAAVGFGYHDPKLWGAAGGPPAFPGKVQ